MSCTPSSMEPKPSQYDNWNGGFEFLKLGEKIEGIAIREAEIENRDIGPRSHKTLVCDGHIAGFLNQKTIRCQMSRISVAKFFVILYQKNSAADERGRHSFQDLVLTLRIWTARQTLYGVKETVLSETVRVRPRRRLVRTEELV